MVSSWMYAKPFLVQDGNKVEKRMKTEGRPMMTYLFPTLCIKLQVVQKFRISIWLSKFLWSCIYQCRMIDQACSHNFLTWFISFKYLLVCSCSLFLLVQISTFLFFQKWFHLIHITKFINIKLLVWHNGTEPFYSWVNSFT